MKIIVDAFGGDNAPLAVLQGCEAAVKEYGVDILLTGDKNVIEQTAKQNNISLDGMEIEHTDLVMPVEAEPTDILKSYKESSLAKGLTLLAENKGDAFVSAGSTGALVVGATFIVKRIKGIKRLALAPIIPSEKGQFMLLDVGANTECRPEMLLQFAIMGSAYMEKIMGVKNPKVGLVNIGAEETKGCELQLEAFKLLKQSNLNFIGNLEARYIPRGDADVVVADGFTGNIILKLIEGMAKFFSNSIKTMFYSSAKSKFCGLLLKNNLKQFKKKMDYTEFGGALLMGTAKPVIKAHGSSNANAFKNAIKQAELFAQKKVIEQVAQQTAEMKSNDKSQIND